MVVADGSAVLPTPQLDGSGTMVDAGDKWVKVSQRVQAPDLCVFSNLLSGAECDALIEAAEPRLLRSRTIDTQTGGEALNRDRTSDGMFFTRAENAVVQRVEWRVARLLRWPVKNFEGMQVLRYRLGAQYKPHYDYFDPEEPATPALLARGGQRVATLIMYLQEPERGGATLFPGASISVPPVRGSAVFFSYAEAHPASLSLHGGQPVEAGEKWIATLWLRQRQFR
jgi:prolyl 4-hydroxylase